MISLTVALMLAQVPEAPPLVSAPPEAVVASPEPVSAVRITASFVGALVGVIPAALLVFAAPRACRERDAECRTLVPAAGMLLAPATVALGALLGHKLAGGKGHFLFGLFAAMTGTAMTMFASIFVLWVAGEGEQVRMTLFGVGSALTFALTAGALEFGHRLTSESVALGIAPVPGGAVVSLGGAF